MSAGELELTTPGPRTKTEGERVYYATQWQLMWWQYRKNRLAFIGMFILAVLYLMAIFAGVIAPYEATERFGGLEMAPPTKIHIRDEDGALHRPFVYAFDFRVNMDTLRREFVENTSERYPIRFFVSSERHKIMGLIPISGGSWVQRAPRSCSLGPITWAAIYSLAPCTDRASRCSSASPA